MASGRDACKGLSLRGWDVAQCGVLAYLCQALALFHYSGVSVDKQGLRNVMGSEEFPVSGLHMSQVSVTLVGSSQPAP